MTLTTKTKRLPREELALFLPNHRAIKAFEDLTLDVSTTIPEQVDINEAELNAVRSQLVAINSKIASIAALAQRDVRPGANVTVTQDAQGYTIASSGGGGGVPDDDQNIIANRVFGV